MSDVKDNPAASRFEMESGGAVAFVEYERAGDGRIALLHSVGVLLAHRSPPPIPW